MRKLSGSCVTSGLSGMGCARKANKAPTGRAVRRAKKTGHKQCQGGGGPLRAYIRTPTFGSSGRRPRLDEPAKEHRQLYREQKKYFVDLEGAATAARRGGLNTFGLVSRQLLRVRNNFPLQKRQRVQLKTVVLFLEMRFADRRAALRITKRLLSRLPRCRRAPIWQPCR